MQYNPKGCHQSQFCKPFRYPKPKRSCQEMLWRKGHVSNFWDSVKKRMIGKNLGSATLSIWTICLGPPKPNLGYHRLFSLG